MHCIPCVYSCELCTCVCVFCVRGVCTYTHVFVYACAQMHLCMCVRMLSVHECKHNVKTVILTTIPYPYKFSRDVNFAVFVDNLSSTKFKSSKFFKTVVIHLEVQGVITKDPQK